MAYAGRFTQFTRVVKPLRGNLLDAFFAFTFCSIGITGVTSAEASETVDRFAVFVVRTTNVYFVPLVNPPIVHDVAVVAHAGPAGVGVTV